jgi:hypothetical protein
MESPENSSESIPPAAQEKKLFRWSELHELHEYKGSMETTPNHYMAWSNWIKKNPIQINLNQIVLARK